MPHIDPIYLEHQDLQCVLLPQVGGSIAQLTRAGQPVLRHKSIDEIQTGRDAASYPLVPYSNRIAQAQLVWEGRPYDLVKNFAPEAHAIHGTGWENAWSVTAHNGQSAQLTLHHIANASWPFDFVATQTFTLLPNTLRMEIAVTNTSKLVAPVGLGWHPYFIKRPGARLAFAAKGRWEMGSDKLPTQWQAHNGWAGDIAKLNVDHCFDGWTGYLELVDAVHHVQMRSSFERLVVYTTPALSSIAIEPVSHVNNAFNRASDPGLMPPGTPDLGVQRLLPGESFSGTMELVVKPTLGAV